MKKKALYIFLWLMAANVWQSRAQSDLWSVGSAYTFPKSWLSKGVFQPLVYGLTKKTEISTFLTSNIYAPNLALKHRWYLTPNKILISSRHGVYMPGRAIRKAASYGLVDLPADGIVPFILPNYHEILASKFLKPRTSCDLPDYLVTLRLGMKWAIGNLKNVDIHDFSGLYQRTRPYYGRYLWYLGADLDAHFNQFVNYAVDVDFYSVGALKNWAIEHKGLIVWPIDKHWTLAYGYKLHFGTTDDSRRLFWSPLVDISYKFQSKRRSKQGLDLFGQDVFQYDYPMEKSDPQDDYLYEEYYQDSKKKKEEERTE